MTKQLSVRDKAIREKAKVLYFADHSIIDIANILDIPAEDVKLLVYGSNGKGTEPRCWARIKEAMPVASVAAYMFEKRFVFENTTGLALATLSHSLKQLNEDVVSGEVKLALDDMKKLSDIVLGFDKLVRLETGQATEIVENTGLTPQEARQILGKDPFARQLKKEEEIIDVEATEVRQDNKVEGRSDSSNNSRVHQGDDFSSLFIEGDAEDSDGN